MIQETSQKSYREEKLKGFTERHEQILDLLRLRGPMTDFEIAVALGKSDPNYARPRRNELASEKYGNKLEAGGKRRCKVSGKMAIIWRIKIKAPKQMELFQNVA